MALRPIIQSPSKNYWGKLPDMKFLSILVVFLLFWGDRAGAVKLTGGDWAHTGMGLTGLVGTRFLIRSPVEPRWKGGVGPDDGIRSLVALSRRESRDTVARVSDFVLLGTVVLSFQQSIRGADRWPRGLVALNGLLSSLFLNQLTKKVVARQRPLGRGCALDSDYSGACGTSQENVSFFSGHTSLAFTAAGLICAQETNVWCATGLVAAGVVGYFRMASDRHYFSDVLVGVGAGILMGYVIPKSSHGDFDRSKPVVLSLTLPISL